MAIHCECEDATHFADGQIEHLIATGQQSHPYGAACTHVIRAGMGLLICAACNKSGHAPGALPRTCERPTVLQDWALQRLIERGDVADLSREIK